MTLIPDNIDSQKSLSAIISYSFYPISSWNLRFFTTFLTTTLQDIRDSNYLYSVSNRSVRLNLNNSIDLGKNYSLQLWGFYNSRSVNGINITLPNGSLNFGIQKKVDNITFTFPLTITPFFYGSGSVGKGFLLRPTITAYMANQQDVNSRSLVAIKADNPILVNPIGVLFTIQR